MPFVISAVPAARVPGSDLVAAFPTRPPVVPPAQLVGRFTLAEARAAFAMHKAAAEIAGGPVVISASWRPVLGGPRPPRGLLDAVRAGEFRAYVGLGDDWPGRVPGPATYQAWAEAEAARIVAEIRMRHPAGPGPIWRVYVHPADGPAWGRLELAAVPPIGACGVVEFPAGSVGATAFGHIPRAIFDGCRRFPVLGTPKAEAAPRPVPPPRPPAPRHRRGRYRPSWNGSRDELA